jgi:hypothetical protein
VVLTAYDTGNALPAWAPLRVVIGHGPESANLGELSQQVDAFYSLGGTDATRLEFIAQLGVRYVFWGPAEHELGDWDPNQAAYLKPLHRAGEYAVFEVVGE